MSGEVCTGAKVLVVDDDEVLAALARRALEHWGFTVLTASDGSSGLHRFYDERPDLVVLDLGLPDRDGWEVLERIRELDQVPVLMLTANDRELDKVRALRGGADDYLTKPFGQQELPARVEALLRRAAAPDGKGAAADVYSDPRLFVDHRQRLVRRDGEELRLTPLEFRLLAAFVRNPNQVLSRDQLISAAWHDELVQPEQVKLYVSRLRRKLGGSASIETVRGFGYRFRPSV